MRTRLSSLIVAFVLAATPTSQAAEPGRPRHRTEKHVMVPMRDGVKLSPSCIFPQARAPGRCCTSSAMPTFARRHAQGLARLAAAGYVVAAENFRGAHSRKAPGSAIAPWLGRAAGRLRHRRMAGQANLVHRQGRHVRQLAGRLCPELPGRDAAAAPRLPVHDRHRPEPVTTKATASAAPPGRSASSRWTRLPQSGRQPQAAGEWFAHPTYDDYWAAEDCTRHFDKMNVPCFTIGSWYDFMCVGSVESFIGRQHRGGPNSRANAATPDRPLAARRHQGNRPGSAS